MRRKTRIIVLIVLASTLLLGGGAAYLLRQRSLDQSALASRALGMEAAKAGNHKDALHQIGRYLQRFGQDKDAEALYEYAHARKSIQLPNGKHIQQAIPLLLRAVQIDPDYSEAQQELLDLYLQGGYRPEALKLAETLLEKNPDDVAALRAKANAHFGLREFDKATVLTTRIAELAPLDIQNHILALALMEKNSASAEEIRAYPESQKGYNAEEPAFQLVQAFANESTNNHADAVEWAKRAAESVQADSKDLLLVNNFLVRFGLFDESLKLLTRTAPLAEDPEVRQRYCERLFESGDMRQVLAQTEGNYAELSSPILGVRAMALGRENNKDELQKLVSELDSRSDDSVADAWVPLLNAIWLTEGSTPQDMVTICSGAIEADPTNPFYHYFQGIAYEQLGETEKALTSWQNTLRISPAWIDPIFRTAGLLASKGRHAEAFGLAQEAQKRAPNNVIVAAAAAEIIGANIDGLPTTAQQQLLQLSQQVQSAIPLEPRTLPLVVDLLARQGDTAGATAAIQSALDSQEALPENTYLKLAELSDKHALGLAQACFEKVGGTGGTMTPALAYAQAAALLRSGDPDGGRALLEKASAAAGSDLQWQVVLAQYLEQSGSEDAPKAWAAIASAAPENAMIQLRVLNSKAAWNDTAMIDQVIKNVEKLTGNDSDTWKVARARWLLMTDPSQKAAAEAASTLNSSMQSALPQADRYALLANALERLKNIDGAIDALEQAAQIAPDSVPIRFELLRLLFTSGKSEKAAIYLDQIVNAKTATPEDLRRAATLLARQGETDRAIEVVLKLHPTADQVPPLDMLLAQLYRQNGQPDKAEAICNRYLQEKPDASVVEISADLFASQGKTEEAQAALRVLDTLTLEPGTREMILAEHSRSYGTPDETNRLYQEAIAAANTNPAIWRRTLAYQARNGELDRALTGIAEAAAACPEDKGFVELAGQTPLLQNVQAKPMALPFILAAIEKPEMLPDAISALEIVNQAVENEPAKMAEEFRTLVDKSPRFLPATTMLIRLYGALNRHDDAAALASKAMLDFPSDIEPALLAADSFAAAGKWVDALRAAQELKKRAPANSDAADLMIANAQISLDRSADALATIQPYLDKESSDPNAYSPLIANQARALIHSNRIEEAADLLRPRLAQSTPWRMAWLRYALTDITTESVSAEWLNEVAPLLPEDAIDERVALASAWQQLSARTQNNAYRDNARTLLEALASRPNVTGGAIFALAVVAEQDNNFESAETYYRRALELDPNLIAAANNLAMRYITENKNLDEALKLAQQAAQAAPDNANCQDTLAQAQAALGDYAAAIQSLEKAAAIEPGNRQWTDRIELFKQKIEGGQSNGKDAN